MTQSNGINSSNENGKHRNGNGSGFDAYAKWIAASLMLAIIGYVGMTVQQNSIQLTIHGHTIEAMDQRLSGRLSRIEKHLDSLNKSLKEEYVKQDQFESQLDKIKIVLENIERRLDKQSKEG